MCQPRCRFGHVVCRRKEHGPQGRLRLLLERIQARIQRLPKFRLGPWIVDADVRIKVICPLETRAQRTAKRDGMTLTEAMKHVKERDNQNRKRYMKVYSIDIDDETKFDAVPEQRYLQA